MDTKQDELTRAILPDLILVEDLATRLRLSKSRVRTHLRSGSLPGRKVGRRWVIERTALLAALSPTNGTAPFHLVEGDERGDA